MKRNEAMSRSERARRDRRHGMWVALAAVLVVGSVAAGCADSDDDAGVETTGVDSSGTGAAPPTLSIEEQRWVGAPGDQPEPDTTTHTAEVGAEIPLGGDFAETTLRVDDIDDGEISISVDSVAPVNPGGGINMNDCGDHEYTIASNESVEFATCTMDAGTTWQVTNQTG